MNEIGNLRTCETANNSKISTIRGQVDMYISHLKEQTTMPPDTAPNANLGVQPDERPTVPFMDHKLEEHLKKFMCKLYNGQASLEAIFKFFKSVKHYVRLSSGTGITLSDKCIDID